MSDTLNTCNVQNLSKELQDGFTNHEDGSSPVKSKTIITNANIAAVAGLIKRDVRKKKYHPYE